MFRQMYRTLSGFFTGLLVGVGMALLMAPTSGEQTRQRLSTNFEQAQRSLNMALEDYQAKARQLSDISRQMVAEQKSSLETGANEVKNVVKAP